MTAAYEESWTAYAGALNALYRIPAEQGRGGSELSHGPELEDLVDHLIDRSDALREAAMGGLSAPEHGIRELAQLQLISAAALDVLTAADLMEAEEGDGHAGDPSARGGSLLRSARMDLEPILATPQAAGIDALGEGVAERGARPHDPRTARLALMTAVDDALQDIVAETSEASGVVARGLVGIAAPTVAAVAAEAIHDVLRDLGDVITGIARKAARLVVSAVRKIVAALGSDVEGEARREAADWVKEMRDGKLPTAVLTWLYEPERIKRDVAAAVGGESSDVATLANRAAAVAALAEHLAKQTKAIKWLARGLIVIRAPVMALQPWGPPVLVAAHLTGLGYAVFVGGDYIDWYRTERFRRLDRVGGVRRTALGQ